MSVLIPFSVDLKNVADVETAIVKALAGKLDKVFSAAVPGIKQGTAEEVGKAIRVSPEYTSLLTGELWHQLGIKNPDAATEAIISTIGESIQVVSHGVHARGKQLDGRMTISILRADYGDILGLSESSFTSENGFQVPWLQWLLTGGNELLNSDYQFLGNCEEWSRTGFGIMARSHKGWKVPDEFSGTERDNWLIRALSDMRSPIVAVLKRELQKAA